jgi:D-alanyl-D-alanine carboxypeptidase/D-alanyl-D-alanine-endopeptidase (penicillin-binding protein 4)
MAWHFHSDFPGAYTVKMKKIAALILMFFLAACATTRQISTLLPPSLALLSSSPYAALKDSIDSLLPDSLFPPSNVGIKVISLNSGETLYSLNENMLFNPASNQKLFTSAAALDLLGKDFTFKTTCYADTQSWSLFVKGGGDPLLSTENLDSIASAITKKMRLDKRWRLVGEVSYFDGVWFGPGWAWDEEPASYGMVVSPLSFNSNCIRVVVMPGGKPGDPVRVTMTPPTSYVTLENSGVTVRDSAMEPLRISRKWRERSNVITVTGHMRMNDSLMRSDVSVWLPEMYTLTVLAEKLRSRGMMVDSLLVDTLSTVASEVTRYERRIDTVLTYLNKVSDNLSGECLLKTLAAEELGPPGTTAAGVSLVRRFVGSFGDTTKIVIADGSGVSRYNLTSPNATIKLLQRMYADSLLWTAFNSTLPIAGIDGTLNTRMKGTHAQGNLRAKTGTLHGASTFSGYVQTADGELLAFSIMMQNFPGGSKAYRLVQDRIGILLSGVKRNSL